MNKKKKLRIISLGGVDEVGKNMTVLEYGQDIMVIDSGLKFPSIEMLGVDLVIPDTTYLEENVDKLRGIVLTHGHEDHIGSLPYVLKKLNVNVPIYGTNLTIALAKRKLQERGITDAEMLPIKAGDVFELGCFKIEAVKISHSIAGAIALAIQTPLGMVIHTGDFKFDYTPEDGAPTNVQRLAVLGSKGVLALLSDSTNAERPGYTMSEDTVALSFDRLFDQAKGRMIIATFASNVHRLQQVINSAVRHGRKVCFQGRSMINVAAVSRELGELKVEDDIIVDVDKLKNLPDNKIVILTTGSQGEPMSGLVRMATSEHGQIDIREGDMIILSASPIPGNEKMVSNVINNLMRRGAEVVYERLADVHVSGHACQEELKLMMLLVKPKYFLPVHGEYRQLKRHTMIAESIGISPKNIFIPEIGKPIEITHSSAEVAEPVSAGSIMIDGAGIGDVSNIVLRDRRILSQDGLMAVALTIDRDGGQLISGPELFSRGFVYVRESEELMDNSKDFVRGIVEEWGSQPNRDVSALKVQIRNKLRNYLYDITKRNPMILPIILEIAKDVN